MDALRHRDPGASALLTDLYQLTMLQTYYEHAMTDTAVFELFFRRLPPGQRNFFLAAGLELRALDGQHDLGLCAGLSVGRVPTGRGRG